MAQPSSRLSSPSSPVGKELGSSVHFPLPIGDDIEERMASISYLTSSFEGREVVVKAEVEELPDLRDRVELVVGAAGAVDLSGTLLGRGSPKQGSGAEAVSTSVGVLRGGEPMVEEPVASPVYMGEDNAEPRYERVVLQHVERPQLRSPHLVSEGQFTVDLLGRWAQEDHDRANERGRLISSWYAQVASTREENYSLYERVDQLSEELRARSRQCLLAEKSLEESRLVEATLRAVVDKRDSYIAELKRELEDVKAQLARSQRIAMGPDKAIPADVASSSVVVATEGEPLFGAELSARLLFYYRNKMNMALDYLSESHGFDLGVFERGGYSDRELEAFVQKIPEAGVAPSYLLKP